MAESSPGTVPDDRPPARSTPEPPAPGARTGPRRRLTRRRLLGLDRSGAPPPQTLAGQPLRPLTWPNLIGLVRLSLIPIFLILSYRSPDGHDALAAVLFAVVAWSDYADGMVARVTGQYSRLGALLDPVTDRLLIVSGVAVCWSYELLPRWALAVLVAREALMLVAGRIWLTRGLELRINWMGRLAVWPVMSAVFFALVDVSALAHVFLYAGLVLTLAASYQYLRDGRRELRVRHARADPHGSSSA
ncbi:MAG TPA: CDP-alcohol phosphatidyltransferase family protein [Solirubrobacteraceae bacterium]|nr:CDP-alcohol phosphatidyltransferase family protein [Solirubrobacteraceae bacterium]